MLVREYKVLYQYALRIVFSTKEHLMSSTKSFVRSVFCIYFLTSKLIANFICSQKAVSLKVLICCWTQLHMFLLLLMLTKAIDCLIWDMWFFNKNTQAQCSYMLWEEDYLFLKCPSLFQWDSNHLLFVYRKLMFQEGFLRLWRGTNAGLALAVPTVSF